MNDNCLLELKHISKSFSGVKALKNVDLRIRAGKIHALAGENGAGKSTLVKIIVGVHQPDADSGEMTFEGKVIKDTSPQQAQDLGIGIIYQEFSLVPYMTVFENIFLGREIKKNGLLDKKTMRKKATKLLTHLGMDINPNAKISDLSIAQQQFVEIAKAISLKVKILILDEPTAPLTPVEVENLFSLMKELRNNGVGMVFISHHLEEIFEICDEMTCLRDGESVGYSEVKDLKIDELIRMMVGRDVSQTYPKNDVSIDYTVQPLLSIKSLQRTKNLPKVSFNLYPGEILGIAGLVGAGRSELVRALTGADQTSEKIIELDGKPVEIKTPQDALNLGIGLLPEDRKTQGLILDFSVEYNVVINTLKESLTRFKTIKRRSLSTRTLKQVKDLGIKTPSERTLVRNLSGGNQQKVVIARWLSTKCRILIFDEPTRGIDVGAKAEIYELMRGLTRKGLGIIMISSELPEVVGISDRVLVMRKNDIVATLKDDEITPDGIMEYAAGAKGGNNGE